MLESSSFFQMNDYEIKLIFEIEWNQEGNIICMVKL